MRVRGRDLDPGRLLEPVGGEEQVIGEVAELGARPGAQAGLGEGRGHQLGIVAGAPQAGLEREDLVLGVGRKAPQQGLTLGGRESSHHGRIHPRILPSAASGEGARGEPSSAAGSARGTSWHSS